MLIAVVGSNMAISQEPASARDPFTRWDKDKDGFVTKAEFPANLPSDHFENADNDQDGRISKTEDQAFRARMMRNVNGGERNPLPAKLRDRVASHRNLVYSKVGDRDLPLDLYVPKDSHKPVPLIVWVHGGGWMGGTKDPLGARSRLLETGYALASVEYRLSGEAIFPAAIEDCKAAVSFLRLNAKQYGLDPDRFGAWGSSAGGHLVALMGVTNDKDIFDTHDVCKQAPATVQAVCNWFGPTDFLRMNDTPGAMDHNAPQSPESRFLGGPILENKEKVAKANPITYVSKGDPPMLLMHGDKDRLVIYNQSELLYEALQAAKVESELYRVENGGHGFGGAKDKPAELFERVLRFFDQHLKPDSAVETETKK